MAASQVEQWYLLAVQKWPVIRWTKSAFAAHVKGETPAHPIDLFLAGAAGYRVDAAWGVIHEEIGPKARNVLERQPTADLSTEELWSEAIARLIAEDDRMAPLTDGRKPAAIVRYRGMVSLLNYMILIAKRIGIQRKRQMRPSYSLSAEDADESPRDIEHIAPSPAELSQSREEAAALVKAMQSAYSKLSAEQQFLIAMVYRNGMKQKEAGSLLKWSEFKTCRSLGAAMETLKGALRQWAQQDWNESMAAAWEQCLQKCWVGVQVPPRGASNKIVSKG